MRRERVLIVDGSGAGPALRAALCLGGFDAVATGTAESALALLPSFAPAAIVSDAALPGCDGPGLSEALRELGSDAVLVAVVPAERIDAAVAALRAGAEGFLVRPVAPEQVELVLERALERRRLRQDRDALRRRVCDGLAIAGAAPEIAAAIELLGRVAPTKASVLLRGEPGTGKHHFAQALHEASPRREAPFVRLSCAGLSETVLEAALFGQERGAFPDDDRRRAGAFEQASGGTLYLHEVGQLPPGLQIKLLRVLQQGELERVGGEETVRVDVRVVAGTQRDLAAEVQAGRFRGDLYYRLHVVELVLPPLRERKGDLPALVAHFLERHAAVARRPVTGVSAGALSALFTHAWPGNVRELELAVLRAIERSRGPELAAEDLSPVLHGARAEEDASGLIPGATLFEIEREAILRTLDRVGGSTARAAEVLGVSVRKIQYRLKEYRDGAAGRRTIADVAFSRDVKV